MNPFIETLTGTFVPTLNQMGLLFLFIAVGYLLAKIKAIPENAAGVLSKLENYVLIPASILSTFIRKFTVESIGTAMTFFIGGFATILISIPIAMLVARICSKDPYIRKIYTYGIAFSNFGFMGYAVVLGIFPDIAVFFSELLGIEAPSNFVFLVTIFIVLFKLFSVAIDLSVQKRRLNALIQRLAIMNYEKKREDIDLIKSEIIDFNEKETVSKDTEAE